MDAQLEKVACRLAGCEAGGLLIVRWREDGALVVIVQSGQKYVYTPEQVEAARAALAAPEVVVREAIVSPALPRGRRRSKGRET